jgi:hypothetical protein
MMVGTAWLVSAKLLDWGIDSRKSSLANDLSDNPDMLIPIEKYRNSPDDCLWDLPVWGHPLAQGVLPLFFGVAGKLLPIGTAFTLGSTVAFVVSALHNILEVFDHELRLQHLVSAPTLPEAIDVREVEVYVLHQRVNDSNASELRMTLWPVESFTGAPPSDVAMGFPQFDTTFPTLAMPVSFDVPAPGTRVWAAGYTEFTVPAGGIELAAVRAGTFDWQRSYSHRFVIAEGHVDRIFARRFSSAFVNSPCFTFSTNVLHGQSGGPVFDTSGLIRGVVSAGAEGFFDRPATIASFIQPLLFNSIKSGVKLGPVRINSSRPIIDWVMQGVIKTDGSETRIPIGEQEGKYSAGLQVPKEYRDYVHTDLEGYLAGTPAKPDPSGGSARLRRADTDEPSC